LNRFGALGNLIVRRAYAGRAVTLFRLNNGVLQPTGIEVSCRD
jgi:hypothetical protein